MEHIREVFQLLREAGLQMKLKKCQFFQPKVTFLGQLIQKEGKMADPAKTEKVLTSCKSVRQVRQFIGAVSYFRRMIKDFSKIGGCKSKENHIFLISLQETAR